MKITGLLGTSWKRRYLLREFLRTSFWFWPFVVILLTVTVVLPAIDWFDARGVRMAFLWEDLTAQRAHAIVSNFSTSMLTFLVFVLSSLVMVVQLASAQLTPRIMGMTFTDIQARVMTCMLLFSFLLGTAMLGRIEEGNVHLLGIKILVISVLTSVILFLRYLPHLGMSLRPISMMLSVAERGYQGVESLYPHLLESAAAEKRTVARRRFSTKDARVVCYEGRSGVLQAFGTDTLVQIAGTADCIIALQVQVGSFVARGDPLFLVSPADAPVDAATLHGTVAIGTERTLRQDPVFAFRIIVDIANRALSPAVNDPTTAVLALDQLERLLGFVGSRQLDPGVVLDDGGHPRLIFPTPNWDDYVGLAISEIRHYGANSIQVPRRLVAMLEHLIKTLPDVRAAALQEELTLLGKAVKREFVDAAERDRLARGDRQGVGGSVTNGS